MLIYKKILMVTDSQVIEVPKGSELLTVQTQGQDVCVWYTVPNTTETEKITLVTLTTGVRYKKECGLKYVGTYQAHYGGFIGHVFKETEK